MDDDSELEGADDASLNSDDVADMVMGGSSDDGKCRCHRWCAPACCAVYFSAVPESADSATYTTQFYAVKSGNLIIHAVLCDNM
jgi:hypothetical protein